VYKIATSCPAYFLTHDDVDTYGRQQTYFCLFVSWNTLIHWLQCQSQNIFSAVNSDVDNYSILTFCNQPQSVVDICSSKQMWGQSMKELNQYSVAHESKMCLKTATSNIISALKSIAYNFVCKRNRMNLSRRWELYRRHKSVHGCHYRLYYNCLLVQVCRNSDHSNTRGTTTHHTYFITHQRLNITWNASLINGWKWTSVTEMTGRIS